MWGVFVDDLIFFAGVFGPILLFNVFMKMYFRVYVHPYDDYMRIIETGTIEECKQLMARKNFNVNYYDKFNTLLTVAVKVKRLEVCKLLLGCDQIDVNATTTWRTDCVTTALHCAVNKGSHELVELLLSHNKINANQHDFYGRTPLILSIWVCERYGMTKLLLDHPKIRINLGDKWWCTPLMHAAKFKKYKTCKLLLSRGATVCSPRPQYDDTVNEILRNWRMYLPPWNRFETHKYYPKEFNDRAIAWLLCCKRLKVFPKDLHYFILGYVAEAWKTVNNNNVVKTGLGYIWQEIQCQDY